MKKMLVIALALVMVLSLTTTALANENENEAKIGETCYPTLAAALEAANKTEGTDPVTVEIIKNGTYDPFSIARSNITVKAAAGVTATIAITSEKKMTVGKGTFTNVTLQNLTFTSKDSGTTVLSSTPLDHLTLDGCTFIGPDNAQGTALYIHQPNITITKCIFTNWNRGYYTCGDNHAAGKMHFTGNTFTNVQVPIDGYWGAAATEKTDIQITGNIFAAGSTYSSVYVQLWDYAQYQGWLNKKDAGQIQSALRATVKDNTYQGDFMLMATHWNWYDETDVTMDAATQKKTVYMQLVEVDKGENHSVQLTPKDGTVLGFENHTTAKPKGQRDVFYAIPVGSYDVQVVKKEGDAPVVLDAPLTVEKQTADPSGAPAAQKLDLKDVTVAAAAEVGGTQYASLAKAVEAVANNGTIKLLKNNSEQITVSRTVTFTLEWGDYSFTGKIMAGANTRLIQTENGYAFTYTKPSNRPGRPAEDDTVNSADTFDPGMALYAGMALTSALGAAYVTGKKH